MFSSQVCVCLGATVIFQGTEKSTLGLCRGYMGACHECASQEAPVCELFEDFVFCALAGKVHKDTKKKMVMFKYATTPW